MKGSAMYDAMLAETVTIRGHGGDEIEAYLARPMSQGPHGGVVVIHHMPGYDAPTKEIARTFAVHGYNTIMPNLYHRDAPGASPDDAAAAARAQGGVPDSRLIGADDQYPSPEQVDELEQELKDQGKTYEFHRYEGAGHAFFSVNRPAYRPRGRDGRLAAHLHLVQPLPLLARPAATPERLRMRMKPGFHHARTR
jgi:carboxymethylenebutenolidase